MTSARWVTVKLSGITARPPFGWRANAVILLLMANINLFLFYGVDGDLHIPRVFAGVDIALPLAILNVLFFIYLYGAVLAEYLQPCIQCTSFSRLFIPKSAFQRKMSPCPSSYITVYRLINKKVTYEEFEMPRTDETITAIVSWSANNQY